VKGDRSSLVSCYAVTVMCDLDLTLFFLPATYTEKLQVTKSPHLVKSSYKLYDRVCYLIYYEKTKALLEYLLSKPGKVRIGFITAAQYEAEITLSFLELAFDLPRNSLQNCIFVNSSNIGDAHTPKGLKLGVMRSLGIFSVDEKVVLLDDNPYHVKSAEEAGFKGVLATGITLHEETKTIDDGYFNLLRHFIEMALASYVRSNPLLRF
jgi:hypothetical protein